MYLADSQKAALAHRDELFCTRRMNRDGVVEIALGRTHTNGDGKALQHFIGSGTDNMAADNSLICSHRDELHFSARLA